MLKYCCIVLIVEQDICGINVLINFNFEEPKKLKEESKESAVVFLGDNIYPVGMPYKRHKDRDKSDDSSSGPLEIDTAEG